MATFDTALSGLQAASTSLQVLGNNISNSNTVGFKGSNAQFADAYASALANTASTGQVGIGTQVQQIAQQFTQGNIQTTNNPLDVAINGNGFFQLNYNGALVYSRDGQFNLDANGYIVDGAGGQVQGTLASNGVLTGAQGALQINQASLPPQATSGLGLSLNLSSASTPISGAFNTNNATTYNYSTSTTIYDSLGSPHLLTTYYQLASGAAGSPETWNVYYSANGTTGAGGITSGSLATLNFTSTGTISGSATGATSSLVWADGAAASTINVDYTGSTNYDVPSAVTSATNNGYAPGQLSGLSIDPSGVIFGRYSNGQSQTLGQITLTSFPDNQGLQRIGNNYFVNTYKSGSALTGSPGSSNLGVLQSGAVEQSNVDLSSQLVNLIVAQQAYQANAQTIKTENQVVQTLLTL